MSSYWALSDFDCFVIYFCDDLFIKQSLWLLKFCELIFYAIGYFYRKKGKGHPRTGTEALYRTYGP